MTVKDNGYKIHMQLTIKTVSAGDYGSYKCIAKNSLGDTDGTIQLYGEYQSISHWAETFSLKH